MNAAEIARRSISWHNHVVTLLSDAMPDEPLSAKTLRDYELGLEVPVFRVVTRVGKLPNVRSAVQDAVADAPADRFPLAVVKDERHAEELAVMPFNQFLLLVAGWWSATQQPRESSKAGAADGESDWPSEAGHSPTRSPAPGLRLELRLDPPGDGDDLDEI